MARIVILTHTEDYFARRGYLLGSLAQRWTAAGHEVLVAVGPDDPPAGDLAILHVDLSLVPAAYDEACRRYPVVVNGAARDIRKQTVSRHLVRPGDGWTGRVIVKTDLNCAGGPERHWARRDADGAYRIYSSVQRVPDSVWLDPRVVVERFLPEQDARGFWLRAWLFLGREERCTRYLGVDPIVKSESIVAREPSVVPNALRAERERLGFDYGKFDFAVHEGAVVLYDANRTPGSPPAAVRKLLVESDDRLARGIEQWLKPS